MTPNLRWMLILGCLMLAILEAPRSSELVIEDLGGPYSGMQAALPPAPRVDAGPSLLAHGQPESDPILLAEHSSTR